MVVKGKDHIGLLLSEDLSKLKNIKERPETLYRKALQAVLSQDTQPPPIGIDYLILQKHNGLIHAFRQMA